MPICPSTVDNGIVTGLVNTVDCHIRVYVQDSYRSLVGPDTVFATAFTGMLTIYIALFGYKLLLGRGGARLTDLPVIALKIGLILAFLTSWAAYQTVFFNLLFEGPRELLQLVLSPMAQTNEGFNGDVYGGVEVSYRVMTDSAAAYAKQAGAHANLLQGGPALGAGLLWFGAIAVLFITVGLIIAAKIVLGLLLALGPVFIGFFLFDTTRGLFDGWLRTTIAFAFAPLAVHVFGAGMLLMMQPFLENLARNVARGAFDMAPIMTLSMIVAVFAIVMLQAVNISVRIASGFSTPRTKVGMDTRDPSEPGSSARTPSTTGSDRVADISARASREELREQLTVAADRRVGSLSDSAGPEHIAPQQRLGQAYQRIPKPATDGPK